MNDGAANKSCSTMPSMVNKPWLCSWKSFIHWKFHFFCTFALFIVCSILFAGRSYSRVLVSIYGYALNRAYNPSLQIELFKRSADFNNNLKLYSIYYDWTQLRLTPPKRKREQHLRREKNASHTVNCTEILAPNSSLTHTEGEKLPNNEMKLFASAD